MLQSHINVLLFNSKEVNLENASRWLNNFKSALNTIVVELYIVLQFQVCLEYNCGRTLYRFATSSLPWIQLWSNLCRIQFMSNTIVVELRTKGLTWPCCFWSYAIDSRFQINGFLKQPLLIDWDRVLLWLASLLDWGFFLNCSYIVDTRSWMQTIPRNRTRKRKR